MIDKIRERIREAVEASESPCVMWSGGLDSTVVLMLAVGMYPDIDICQFRADFSPKMKAFVDRFVAEKGLKVFSWSPKHRFFTYGEDGIELVDLYANGEGEIPVIRSCVEGTKCLLEIDRTRTPAITPRWDLFLTGVLGTDREYGLPVATEGIIGTTRLYSPLFDLDKESVKSVAGELGIEIERPDTGTIRGCTECLAGTRRGEKEVWCPKEQGMIETVKWNPDENHQLVMAILTRR